MFFWTAATETIADWTASALGTRIFLRPSQRAMLASPDFVRADADAAAKTLLGRRADCRLFDAPLVSDVRAENGWLLFTLDRAAFDAYARRLPDDFPHGGAYVDRRMELLLRHGDAPLADCPAILTAVLVASYASLRGRWTAEDERAVLGMTHGLRGMARVRAEQSAARAAKIILYERRTLECS